MAPEALSVPVLGHAFVGWTTGLAWRGRWASGPAQRRLVPAAVALAYVPDVVSLAASPLWADARRASHSLVLSPLLAALVAIPAARALAAQWPAVLPLVLVSIGLHDVLDLFQGTDRLPLWPLSGAAPALDLLPSGLATEAATFGALWIVALCLVWFRAIPAAPAPSPAWSGATPAGAAFVIAVLAAAAATAHLRDLRELQLEAARRAYASGDNQATLRLLALAERWPSTARPGRIGTLRADALLELGKPDLARTLYVAAADADPRYIWAVAGLAVLEARGDGPSASRRARAAPHVERLEREFFGDAELPRARAEVERRLSH